MDASQTLQITALMATLNTLTPFFVSIVVQNHWSSQVKAVIAMILCALSGVFAVTQAGIDVKEMAVAFPVAVFAMQKSYEQYWKPTGIAPWIESATSLVRRPATVDVGA